LGLTGVQSLKAGRRYSRPHFDRHKSGVSLRALHGQDGDRSARPARAGGEGRLPRYGSADRARGSLGDYSDLTVDPTNDCTFFYTTEYLAEDTVVIGTWRTRVVSFRFPGCK